MRSIRRNSSVITWEPPFSLNLTNIYPDIVYCVEIFNITCDSRVLVVDDCYVTEPVYTFLLEPAFIYEIAVIPRSNVAGAENGSKATINGLVPVIIILVWLILFVSTYIERFVFFHDSSLYIKSTERWGISNDSSITMDVEVHLFMEVRIYHSLY